jgi:methylglutaconyl-CoA hydratase
VENTYIHYTVENRVAYITLNRPEKRNAFNPQLVAELKAAFQNAANDDAAKVIVLRSNGAVFSAGADLSVLQTMQQNSREQNFADSQSVRELYEMIYTLPKVIIAQVQGHAIAGGCGLATVSDFCFAAPEANFGYSEVKIGFIPAIVAVFLLRKIGEGRAKELLLTGKLISAAEAQNFGIINKVVPAADLESTVNAFAQQLCTETSGDSLRMTKLMIAAVQEKPLADALTFAAEQNAASRETPDCKKGIASFLNKEKLVW